MAKAYLSAPFASDTQKGGVHRIAEILAKHGFEAHTPEEFEHHKTAADAMTARLEAMNECELIVSWFDFLWPKGQGIHQILDSKTNLQVPFPPETQEMLAAGTRVLQQQGKITGGKSRRLILTPGEMNAPVEHPTGMEVDLEPHGVVIAKIGNPLNIPDGDVMVELGIAAATGKTIIGVGLAMPMLGTYGATVTDVFVSTLENLDTALNMYVAAGGGRMTPEIAQAIYDTLHPKKETSDDSADE